MHTKEKPYECPYPLCDARFASSSHVTRHVKTHTNQRNFVCQTCGKAFIRSEHLRGHMTLHTGEKPFICFFPGNSVVGICILKMYKKPVIRTLMLQIM